MTTPLSRRDAIADLVLSLRVAAAVADGCTHPDIIHGVSKHLAKCAKDLIAELDRTAPPPEKPKPEGNPEAKDLGVAWVVLDSKGRVLSVSHLEPDDDDVDDMADTVRKVRLVPVEEPAPQVPRLSENTVENQFPLAGPLASAYPEG